MKNHLLDKPVLLVLIFFISCSHPDINNEKKVLDDLQGSWTGIEKTDEMYTHVRLDISGDTFQCWLMITDSEKEPKWKLLPEEMGTFSLSSVYAEPNEPGKFRKLSLSVPGRCCGDKSACISTLSRLLKYSDKNGLQLGKGELTKISKSKSI
jgi:hypothetical protein